MEGGNMYDLCIVGAGMMGSAAARHATTKQGLKVCLIGPNEPKVRQSSSIFGAHYDEGRITRQLDADPTWAKLGKISISRYRQLESDTGIRFFETPGFLVTAHKSSQYLNEFIDTAEQMRIPIELLDATEIRQRYPHLNVADDFQGAVEKENAGYINARKMVSAELTAAHLQGCNVIRDVVTHVTQVDQPAGMKVVTAQGHTISARKVLLAPGAFTHFHHLLPDGMEPDVVLRTQTVVFGELSKQLAEQLKYLPSMVYSGCYYNCGLPPDPVKDGFYYLPPILYPDGKVYMKIGHHSHFENVVNKQEDVKAWYCSPPPLEYTKELTGWLKKLFPEITFKSFHTDTCVTTKTKSGLPYIDLIHPCLGVAIGGNGHAAKSCDEIGRMAADLVIKGTWEHEMPADLFKFQARTSGVAASKL